MAQREQYMEGGSAFPSNHEAWDGMSLRDWFAGQAIAGHLASLNSGSWGSDAAGAEDAAKGAYLVADAMLAVRERREDIPSGGVVPAGDYGLMGEKKL